MSANIGFLIQGLANLQVASAANIIVNPQFSLLSTITGQFEYQQIIIPKSTTLQTLDLGQIVHGQYIFIKTDLPITITLTQTGGTPAILVNTFLMVVGTFTVAKITNASGSTAANVEYLIAGDLT
jgi:hypothetical protein